MTKVKMTKKVRRHSGRYYPRPTTNDKEAQVYIQEEYDDWTNHRDGWRDWEGDHKKITHANPKWFYLSNKIAHMNHKNKKLLKRRQLRKKRNLFK